MASKRNKHEDVHWDVTTRPHWFLDAVSFFPPTYSLRDILSQPRGTDRVRSHLSRISTAPLPTNEAMVCGVRARTGWMFATLRLRTDQHRLFAE